jgi:putative nucleotidyltransferase with HDIG domain
MSEFKSVFLEDLNRQDLSRLDQLPSLPAVVSHLMDVIDDPLASAMDVAYLLREDPPLTARVLRMANSPVYGGRLRIMSVPQAVLRLGMLEIRNLVLSLGVIRAMSGFGRRLDYRAFWQHSLTVALATEALARYLPRESHGDDDGAFAAGLLHDIGRLVLDQFYPDAYESAATLMDRENLTLPEAERRALDTDHAEIGKLVVERWCLPEPIVIGIAYHHRPEDALPSQRRVATLVHVAEQTCTAHGLGDPLERVSPVEPVEAWESLGLSAGCIGGVVEATLAGARKSALLLALAR